MSFIFREKEERKKSRLVLHIKEINKYDIVSIVPDVMAKKE